MITLDKTTLEQPAIKIRGLRVEARGRLLLDLPELAIRQGERVAIIGPNGAGKSSLLKVLGGFLPASDGSVTVLGRSFGGGQHPRLTSRQWRALRAEIGQVMQGLHLVSRLSAIENVVLGALARPRAMSLWQSWVRLYPPTLLEEARAVLEAVGLAERCDTRASDLSGGERQKVALARLRLQRAQLILADEPTSALDPSAARMACQALLRAAGEATLLTVVHDPALLPQLAERVIAINDGRLLFDLSLRALTPAHLQALYARADARDDLHGHDAAGLGSLTASMSQESAYRWSTRLKEGLFQT